MQCENGSNQRNINVLSENTIRQQAQYAQYVTLEVGNSPRGLISATWINISHLFQPLGDKIITTSMVALFTFTFTFRGELFLIYVRSESTAYTYSLKRFSARLHDAKTTPVYYTGYRTGVE